MIEPYEKAQEYESVKEWEEMSKLAKSPRVRCPKGHFLSCKTFYPMGRCDQDGNPVVEDGAFNCKACGTWHDASKCKEERKR